MAEITTTQTMGNKTITTTINTGARGPQGEPGTDANVTQANIEAAITDKPGFREEIGTVGADGTGAEAAAFRAGIDAADQFAPANAPFLAAFWSTSQENLKLAVSVDGKTFSQFATNLTSGPNATLRDPSIILKDGVWYVAFTNNSFSNSTSFSIYKSVDLFTWTTHATVSLAAVSGLNKVWSPQLFIDDDGTVRAYVAGNDGTATDTYGEFSIYHLLGSADLLTWGAPTAVLSPTAGSKHYIDPFVIKDGGTYYLWVKEEYGNFIEVATSTSPDSGFALVNIGNWASWGSGIEGTCIVRTPSGFRIYLDRYVADTGLAYATSASLLSGWSALADIGMAGSVFRHGSVYPLETTESAIRVAAAVSQTSAMEFATLPFGPTRTAGGHTVPTSLKIEERKLSGANYWTQLIISHINGSGTYKGAIFLVSNDNLQICRGVNANGTADPSVVMVDVPMGTRIWDFKAGIKLAGGPTITSGSGTPEGAVTAPVGSLFTRTNGGAGSTLYVKESGTGNTGWIAK